jgi:hypothetical protein
MRKRTARKLRRIADRLDPKPARWYASAWQQSANTSVGTGYYTNTASGSSVKLRFTDTWADALAGKPKRRHRVLADYLTTMDLKKLRP